ncbi:MAG: hypothetical protein ACJ8AT_24290 [Hyalangium sp.]|uniref:hypothetical protein n=1 Tax=Hyalangium sp. TaxID=2028555 RepID=UPI00389A9E6F
MGLVVRAGLVEHLQAGHRDAGLVVRAGLVVHVQAVTSTRASWCALGLVERVRASQTRARRTRSSWREQGTTFEQDLERIRLPAEPVGS